MAGEDTVIRLDIDSEPAVKGLRDVEQSLASAAEAATTAAGTFEAGADIASAAAGANARLSEAAQAAGVSLKALGDAGERQARVADAQRAAQAELASMLRRASQDQAASARAVIAAAQAESEAQQRAVGDIRARVSQSAALRAQIERMNVGHREQSALLSRLESQARQGESALREMFADGRISAEQFESELGRVQSELAQVTAQRAALAPVPSSLNASLGEIAGRFDTVKVGGLQVTNVLGGLKVAGAAAAAGMVALGGAVAFGLSEIAASEDALRKLRAALAAQGAETASNIAALSQFSDVLQQTSRFSGDAATEAQALGLSLGVPVSKIREFTQAAADLAAARGIGLEESMKALGSTLDGTAGKAAQLVPQLQGLTEAQLRSGEAAKVVARMFGGSASADATTLSGSIAQVKNVISDAAKALAVGVAGTNDLGEAVQKAKDWIVQITPQIEGFGRALGGIAEKAMDAVRELGFLFETGQSEAGRLGAPMALKEKAEDDVAATKRAIAEQQELLRALQNPVSNPGSDAPMRDQQIAVMGDAQRAEEIQRVTRNIAGLNVELGRNEDALDKVTASLAKLTPEERAAGAAAKDLALGVTDGATGIASMESEADKAAEALREQLAAISALTVRTAEQTAEIEGMALPLEQEVALYAQLKASSESAISTLGQLYREKKIDAEEYRQRLENILGLQQQLASETLVPRAQDRISRQGSEMFEPAPTFAPEGEMSVAGGEAPVFRDPEAEGAIRQVIEDEIAAKERLKAIDEEMFQLRLTIAEQGGPRLEQEQMLNDLLWEQAALADGVIDAEERLEQTRMRAMATAVQKGQQDVARMAAVQQSMGMMTQAAGQLGAGLMKMALTGEGSFKQMAQAALQGLAVQSAGKAIFELAEGFAALALAAMGHPTAGASAAMHFKSAAMFGVMAAAFGGMSAAAGQPSEGGGGDSGGASSSDTLTDQGSARRAATEEPQAGPRVQVNISGAGFIGEPDTLARHLEGYLSDSIRDSGGRSGSYRG